MENIAQKPTGPLLLLETVCLGLGAYLAYLLLGGGSSSLSQLVMTLYEYVGITLISLAPLMIWAVDLVITGNYDAMTLSYIGAQAKEQGFIGTLIGISIMLYSLGISFQEGDIDGIRHSMAGFAQATNSTLIGCVIAAFCKHFGYRAAEQDS